MTTTQWQRVRDAIRDLLRDGEYSPGERLPTEHALAERFGVHRHTLRRAVSSLAEEGLIRSERGSGMYVGELVLDYPVARRTRFTESVERQNRSRGRRILETRIEVAGSKVGRTIGIRADAKVLFVRSVSHVDERPISLSSNWFNRRRCAGITRHVQHTDSITEALSLCGIEDYFRDWTQVTTNLPQREEAEMLKQPPNRPVLITESVDVDELGEPICFGRTIWAGDRIQLRFETGD
ncbi:MAG: phosphonate metabolism transcriptional regulator PhnF [Gammaproteobacteria bacterium]